MSWPVFLSSILSVKFKERSTSRQLIQIPDVYSCRQYGYALEHLLNCSNMIPIWICCQSVQNNICILTTVRPQQHMDIVSMTVCLNSMQAIIINKLYTTRWPRNVTDRSFTSVFESVVHWRLIYFCLMVI